jgi:hypothetical protein
MGKILSACFALSLTRWKPLSAGRATRSMRLCWRQRTKACDVARLPFPGSLPFDPAVGDWIAAGKREGRRQKQVKPAFSSLL